MPEYRVKWEIDVDADDPVTAARRSLQIQRDVGSTATVFDVVGPDGSKTRVDLLTQPSQSAELYDLEVVATAPTYLSAHARVAAESFAEAERLVRAMYENDELDFDRPQIDYDEAKIVSIEDVSARERRGQ
jgi:hypothetical protein